MSALVALLSRDSLPLEVTFSRIMCSTVAIPHGAAGWAQRNIPVFAGGSRRACGSCELGCTSWSTSCPACGKGRSGGKIGQCRGPPPVR